MQTFDSVVHHYLASLVYNYKVYFKHLSMYLPCSGYHFFYQQKYLPFRITLTSKDNMILDKKFKLNKCGF